MLNCHPQGQVSGAASGMRRVAIVGFGAAGSRMVEWFRRTDPTLLKLVALCVRERQVLPACEAVPGGTRVCVTIEQLLECKPEVVVEAAGQRSLVEWGVKALSQGCELQVLSIGALADSHVREAFTRAALAQGGRIAIPAGALAGFRGLLSLRQYGLESVAYTSTKPPRAWLGTPGAEDFDLTALEQPVTIYSGNAAEAAQRFPANANVAAAVALAGIGFERTAVRLVADPRTELNTGHLEAVSQLARLEVTMAGRPSRENPKTSEVTAMSVVSALHNSTEAISFI